MQGSNFTGYTNPLLRLLVGYAFIEDGFAKLLQGPDAFACIFATTACPLPHLASWRTIGTEILGGLARLLGLLVFWPNISMAVVLLVSLVSIHLPYGFISVRLVSVSISGAKFGPVGHEIDLLYLAALSMLTLQSPGPLAVDSVLQGRRIRTASSEKKRLSAPSCTQRCIQHAALDVW